MTVKSRGPRHHSCRRGKPIRAVLRDGTTVYGTFKEPNRRYLLLDGHKRIPWSKVLRFVQVPRVTVHLDPKTGTGK